MNPFSVYYHGKIEEKLYTADWQNYFETKTKQNVSGSGIDIIENERIRQFLKISMRQYCILY